MLLRVLECMEEAVLAGISKAKQYHAQEQKELIPGKNFPERYCLTYMDGSVLTVTGQSLTEEYALATRRASAKHSSHDEMRQRT